MASHLKNLSDFSHTTVPSAEPFKFGIVVAAWNAEVTGKLYSGAYDSLLKHARTCQIRQQRRRYLRKYKFLKMLLHIFLQGVEF